MHALGIDKRVAWKRLRLSILYLRCRSVDVLVMEAPQLEAFNSLFEMQLSG